MSELFRPRAVDRAMRRLEGEVLIAMPLSYSVLTIVFAVIVTAGLLFTSLATYARRETVQGWLTPDRGFVRVTAPGDGVVDSMDVEEGQIVEAGAIIAGVDAPSGSSARRRLVETRQQLALQEEQLRIGAAELAAIQPVYERGFVSRRDYDARRLSYLAAQQRASEIRMLAEALAREAEFTVVSPVRGRVAVLPLQTGQAVTRGNTLAVVVPDGDAIIAELYVPSRASGFIRVGQEVRLMYQAFPYQRFGAGRGRVEAVSRTVLLPGEWSFPGLPSNEPVFRVHVAIERNFIEAYGQQISLQPGMLLTADIEIDRRTFLEWLLDPLYASARR